ncbi:BrnT family toxin [Candidatus Gottesmanbacteria bacterium]|nr:BrnT family toxin [Candidatus Gottesmanbacteria bacterium]
MDFDFANFNGFDWNTGNLDHIKKHNVGAKECEECFLHKPLIITQDKTHSQKEERFRVYGHTDKNRLLAMVFTVRNNKIRVISARNQSNKEKKEFKMVGGDLA